MDTNAHERGNACVARNLRADIPIAGRQVFAANLANHSMNGRGVGCSADNTRRSVSHGYGSSPGRRGCLLNLEREVAGGSNIRGIALEFYKVIIPHVHIFGRLKSCGIDRCIDDAETCPNMLVKSVNISHFVLLIILAGRGQDDEGRDRLASESWHDGSIHYRLSIYTQYHSPECLIRKKTIAAGDFPRRGNLK